MTCLRTMPALAAASMLVAINATNASIIPITADGQPAAVIVIGDDATEHIRRMANVLVDIVKQTSAAELPIVTDTQLEADGEPEGKTLICLGPSAYTADATDGFGTDPFAPGGQDAVLRCQPGRIVVTGGRVLNGVTTRYALKVLLRHLGAEGYRRQWPDRPNDPSYIVTRKTKTLSVPADFQVNVQTHFLTRLANAPLPPGFSSWGEPPISIAHNWGGILDPEKELETRPDFFALINDKRVGNMPCDTHPQIIERFVEVTAAAFATGLQAYSLTPHDGTQYLCTCDRCTARYEDPQLTADRFIVLANAVRRGLDEKYPQYRARPICVLAGYGWDNNRRPPTPGVVAMRGVGLWIAHQGCHAHHWFDANCPINHEWAGQLPGWLAAAEEPIGVYEYACYSNYQWDRKWASFPVASVRRIVGDVAAYKQAGIGHLYYEAEAAWLRYGVFRWVDGYACDRAMEDPNIDPDWLLRNLCDDLYGPAADTMFEYYDLLQTRLEQTQLHRGNWYLPDPAEVYTPADVEHLTRLIKQAVWQAQAVGGDVRARCVEAQRVWYHAVTSLNDPDREENGPKVYSDPLW